MLSFFMKRSWSLKSTTKTAISGRPMMLRCCLVESFWFWTLLIVTSIGFLPLFLYKGAASCLWLASKLEESPRKARQVLNAFHKIECRMQNLLIEHLEINSQKYHDLKTDLSRTERHIFKEMGFVFDVEHPHKFISNYLAILKTPPELRLEAWNLANDRQVPSHFLCLVFW